MVTILPKQNFVCTSDKSTADNLINQGLKLLSVSNGIYTFINDTICNFEQIDSTKILHTNQLTF
jgi:hypothetical protein